MRRVLACARRASPARRTHFVARSPGRRSGHCRACPGVRRDRRSGFLFPIYLHDSEKPSRSSRVVSIQRENPQRRPRRIQRHARSSIAQFTPAHSHRRLSIKHAILGLLTGGPLNGYELKSAYEEHLVPGATLHIGQVYPPGQAPAERQVTVEVVAQSERPDRKVYTLTDAGCRELDGWLKAPRAKEADPRNETYLKLNARLRPQPQAPGSVDPFAVIDARTAACLSRCTS